MATVSFLQRLLEGAIDITMTTGRNFAGSTFTRLNSGKGWKRRGRGFASSFDFHNTKNAWGEYSEGVDRSIELLKDPNRGILRKGLEVGLMSPRAVLSAGHMAVAGATDVVGMGGAVAGSALGHAVSAPIQLAAAATIGIGAPVAKATLKGGWKLAKATGMTPTGIAKGTGMAGAELARDAGAIVGGTGKFLWNTRKDPLVGSMLVGGAIIAGAAMGEGDYRDTQTYGSMYGGRGTNMGVFNPQIQSPAWQLTQTYSPGMDGVQRNVAQAAKEDNVVRGAIDPLYGPLGHDHAGATGDLVFALHNLRNGGGQI